MSALPDGGQLATCMPADALPALAHAGGMAPDLPEALVTCRLQEAPAFLSAIADDLDNAASSVLAFRRHAILPGRDAVRLYFGLRRLARLTQDAFQDYWLNHHADYGRRLIPPYSYHQLHTASSETNELAQGTGLAASTLDGVVEVHFPDIEALVRQLSREDVAKGALEDERNFIDHSRSQFWAYREHI
ncbi:EthD domain-containing protein [Novosphingobium malaysiense]|nr:EthD domain-containing protein [Novosphingobium malaysiense]